MHDLNLPTTATGWVVRALRHSLDWHGRAPRAEYWWFALFWTLVLLLPDALAAAFRPLPPGALADPDKAYAALLFGWSGMPALMLMPSFLAVTVRRLHDGGRPGWALLAAALPVIGGAVLLIWQAQPGQPHSNRFGPNPLPPLDLRRRPTAPVLRMHRPPG